MLVPALVEPSSEFEALPAAHYRIPNDKAMGETHVTTARNVIDNIATRLRKRLEGDNGTHPAYKTLSERLERLRERQLAKAHDSEDFLRDPLDLARDLAPAEKAEDESGVVALNLLPDPKYKPEDVPVIVGKVVADIDAIVKEVRRDGWNNTKEGDKAVRVAIRKVLVRYGLPASAELYDRAYAYVSENNEDLLWQPLCLLQLGSATTACLRSSRLLAAARS